MAHQHVRAFDVGALEQGVEFIGDLLGVPGLGAHLAPAHPRPVVGAHACCTGDLPLHPDPMGRETPDPASKTTVGLPWPTQLMCKL